MKKGKDTPKCMQNSREEQGERRKPSVYKAKEIEENNRMGKTRNLFKKIGDITGTFHARMGMIKEKYGKDLTEAVEIKHGWQEYTEELYRKSLNDSNNQNGVVTHLEPDILECEVKWALGSITANKASGGDGIPAELFQICTQYASQLVNSAVATGLEKVSIHSNPKERQCQRMFRLLHNGTDLIH